MQLHQSYTKAITALQQEQKPAGAFQCLNPHTGRSWCVSRSWCEFDAYCEPASLLLFLACRPEVKLADTLALPPAVSLSDTYSGSTSTQLSTYRYPPLLQWLDLA